jgi:hypothetical protein
MKPASATSRSFTEITAWIRQDAIGAQPTLIAEAEYTGLNGWRKAAARLV